MYDGVDYVPMPLWKTLLIQLLNIAGLGPIFGAVLGAVYGPVAFVWITLGGIFFGAMHDYFSGMISIENGGQSLPELIGKYLGVGVKQFMRLFSVFLMVLVGAVFVCGPAGIIENMAGFKDLQIAGVTINSFWLWVIFIYYLIATLMPIDKIIGRIYPLFGFALIFMAIGILVVLLTENYEIPELTSLSNMRKDADKFPIIPTLFVTIACGAISGFHATQSPLMARCVNNERECRFVFYGAMISESIIALIWAAIAMAFFYDDGGVSVALAGHTPAWAVNEISTTTLGVVGGILAILGVVAAPITSGDTAFRSARLIIADMLHIEQRSKWKRLIICVPLFMCGIALTFVNFDIVWRYFAWTNQALATIVLWCIAVYLHKNKLNYWVALIPAFFMSYICSSFVFVSNQFIGMGAVPMAYVWGGVATIALSAIMILNMRHRNTTKVKQ
jgi:carbon starvation protein CstA